MSVARSNFYNNFEANRTYFQHFLYCGNKKLYESGALSSDLCYS